MSREKGRTDCRFSFVRISLPISLHIYVKLLPQKIVLLTRAKYFDLLHPERAVREVEAMLCGIGNYPCCH